jgi:hypothetical protein
MSGVYTAWVGQPVVLQIATEGIRVPLRGKVVGESEDAVRFRLGDDLDIDIYKHMILAVEEDSWAGLVMTRN